MIGSKVEGVMVMMMVVVMIGGKRKNTHKAIASALCSESSHVNDIQETLRACEKVPNICVKTTPK
jgi:hypothetical protein